MEVKLLLAVKVEGEGNNFAQQHLFLSQIIRSSNCNSQVSNCSPNCPLACTIKK